MKAVPRRLLVLGGGSAGVELAQVVRRLGGEAVLIEGADRVLPREPAPLGAALGEALRRDESELMLGMQATAARWESDEYVLQFDGRTDLRGDRLLVATGRRPRVEGIGLETVGVQAGPPPLPPPAVRIPTRQRKEIERLTRSNVGCGPRRKAGCETQPAEVPGWPSSHRPQRELC